MFTNRVRQAIAATLQGLPLSATVDSFTPPKIEFEMDPTKANEAWREQVAANLAAREAGAAH